MALDSCWNKKLSFAKTLPQCSRNAIVCDRLKPEFGVCVCADNCLSEATNKHETVESRNKNVFLLKTWVTLPRGLPQTKSSAISLSFTSAMQFSQAAHNLSQPRRPDVNGKSRKTPHYWSGRDVCMYVVGMLRCKPRFHSQQQGSHFDLIFWLMWVWHNGT